MYKIHLALGFHVNLYHSYRGDNVDASGIGPDIQMIRKILSDLDDLNRAGIPVRAPGILTIISVWKPESPSMRPTFWPICSAASPTKETK